ncbi:MAG: zinc metallopeptidase [Actinomycetia bacterium]|nr:zinc metallopeptidase [Actinomycetes bacterium]
MPVEQSVNLANQGIGAGFMGLNPLFLGLSLLTMLLGLVTQWWIKRTFNRFSHVPTASGLTGAQVAQRILQAKGIAAQPGAPTSRESVGITATKGVLTDHYDPRKGIVALSEPVYGVNSISSTAVAAHEVGHAGQTAQRYFWGEIRTRLVPAVNFGSQAAGILIMMGFFTAMTGLLWLGIIFFALSVIFQLVTLPVEFNASARALNRLTETGLLTPEEVPGARKVLQAAALTYLASAMISVLYLLFYITMARRR